MRALGLERHKLLRECLLGAFGIIVSCGAAFLALLYHHTFDRGTDEATALAVSLSFILFSITPSLCAKYHGIAALAARVAASLAASAAIGIFAMLGVPYIIALSFLALAFNVIFTVAMQRLSKISLAGTLIIRHTAGLCALSVPILLPYAYTFSYALANTVTAPPFIIMAVLLAILLLMRSEWDLPAVEFKYGYLINVGTVLAAAVIFAAVEPVLLRIIIRVAGIQILISGLIAAAIIIIVKKAHRS